MSFSVRGLSQQLFSPVRGLYHCPPTEVQSSFTAIATTVAGGASFRLHVAFDLDFGAGLIFVLLEAVLRFAIGPRTP